MSTSGLHRRSAVLTDNWSDDLKVNDLRTGDYLADHSASQNMRHAACGSMRKERGCRTQHAVAIFTLLSRCTRFQAEVSSLQAVQHPSSGQQSHGICFHTICAMGGALESVNVSGLVLFGTVSSLLAKISESSERRSNDCVRVMHVCTCVAAHSAGLLVHSNTVHNLLQIPQTILTEPWNPSRSLRAGGSWQ